MGNTPYEWPHTIVHRNLQVAQTSGSSTPQWSGNDPSALDGGTVASATTAAQQFTEEFSRQLGALEGALGEAVLITIFVAVVTLIAVQLLKLPIRTAYQALTTWMWLKAGKLAVPAYYISSRSPPEWLSAAISEASSDHDAEDRPIPAGVPPSNQHNHGAAKLLYLSPFLPGDLYMKKIQNLAQATLEHPTTDPALFVQLASGAAIEDMVIAYHLDDVARTNPRALAALIVSDEANSKSRASASRVQAARAIAAAQDNVALAVERRLDDLQIRIMFWWPILMRTAAIIIGIFFAEYFGRIVGLVPRWQILLAMIGLAAGYLASFSYEALKVLGALRPRRQ